ncbi:class I SAM-dependent methyltransferase [Orenia marismortui]|uniref:class I SAM-dependent methyltransferase n=1 Tax=Orenia marismortui TaxID=46469 RepID=UPI0003690D10|nr:class I SAM-dependent methyltransferase [Orenia marismortui]
MEFYEQFSCYYDYIFPLKNVKLNFMESCLKQGDEVLDLATGTGNYAIELAKLGYNVSALDLSSKMIELAKDKSYEQNINIDFKVGDMKDIDQLYSEKKFDLITCIGNSLVHLDNEEEIAEVLSKIHYLLQDNGKLILQIVNYDRIISKNIESLPTINAKDSVVTLLRDYDLKGEKINFKTKLRTPRGEFVNSVLLYPLQSQVLFNLLKKLGYNKVKFYGDFEFNKYQALESFPLVVLAEK